MTKETPYAIIRTGGKQYRVAPGDVIEVELLNPSSTGQAIEFKEVLLFHDGTAASVGQPHLSQRTVHGQLEGEVLGEKVIAFKYKRRKNYRRKVGHRQRYAKVKITQI